MIADFDCDRWFHEMEQKRQWRKTGLRQQLVDAFKAGKFVVEERRTIWPSKHSSLRDEALADHLVARGYDLAIVDTAPAHHRPGLSRQEVARELKAKGYTHMQTYGGPVPLDDWKPYGNGIEDDVRFYLTSDDKAADRPLEIERYDREANAFYYKDLEDCQPFINGLWIPSKEERS